MSEEQFWYPSQLKVIDIVNEEIAEIRRASMRGDEEESCVTILGEMGTEKQAVARLIHSTSRRGKGPWVVFNCGLFPDDSQERELFGEEQDVSSSKKLGFFEIARGGTLFLDEVGRLGRSTQAKLLEALETKRFRRLNGRSDLELDVRIIASMDDSIKLKIQHGRFIKQLHQILATFTVEVPPLRNRTEDIVPIALQIARRKFQIQRKPFPGFAPDFEKSLRDYSWPGNFMELSSVIERVALVWQGEFSITTQTPSAESLSSSPSIENVTVLLPKFDPGKTYTELKKQWSDSFEKQYLTTILARNQGNVSSSARDAQLDRSNFLRLLRRHGLKSENYRKNKNEVIEVKEEEKKIA